jgi:hypothetical protein
MPSQSSPLECDDKFVSMCNGFLYDLITNECISNNITSKGKTKLQELLSKLIAQSM